MEKILYRFIEDLQGDQCPVPFLACIEVLK